MSTQDPRREIVRFGELMYRRRYVVAAEGNLSVRLGGDVFLATPPGLCKGWLTPDDLVRVAEDGGSVDGDGRRASSEWGLHREIYRRCPDARAICHAHPPYATAWASTGRPLDPSILTETSVLFAAIPLAPPAVPGSDEVAASVRDLLPEATVLLMGNHGVVAWGKDLTEAYFRLETVERLAEVTILADLAGGARRLPTALLRRISDSGD